MMEAVLDYTASDTIHVVAHSLGVTMADVPYWVE